LMSADPEAAIRAVVAAVRKRRLSEKRIDESVLRVLSAKQRVGLDSSRLVDVEAIADAIESPEAMERTQQVADRAVTLVRNEGSVAPLRTGDGACFVVLTENRYSTQGHALQEELGRRAKGARITALDPAMPETEIDEAARQNSSCAKVVVAAFVSVAAYRGNVALPGSFPKLMETLISSGRPVILVALGNPYLIRNFPGVAAYLTSYSSALPSEIAVAKALFGEIPITGRLPVSIPQIANVGDGLKLPAAK
ncbi:MAG: glycoside hydrolase family 3 C-terminal domain-containing protein, partial [Bryobacteraceae bacterium]